MLNVEVPDTCETPLAFSLRTGIPVQTIYGYMATRRIPCEIHGNRKYVVWAEAIESVAVKEYRPRPVRSPIVKVEASLEGGPAGTVEIPSHPAPPGPPPERAPTARELLDGPESDRADPTLAAAARRAMAGHYVSLARSCQARGERQAERVMLWLAVEAAGLDGK